MHEPLPIARRIHVDTSDAASENAQMLFDMVRRQIVERCGAKAFHIAPTDTDLTVRFALEADLGAEAFRIRIPAADRVEITGGDALGLVYGAGRFLRGCRFAPEGLQPGTWQGSDAPANPGAMRALYFATHFHNYYQDAPVEEIRRYVQDLALWGFNTLIVIFPHFQYETYEDPAAQEHLANLRELLAGARSAGMRAGLVQVPNQSFASTPEELRWTPVPDDWGRRGSLGVNLCPAKPEARRLLTSRWRRLIEFFEPVGIDTLVFWPYDEGGCGCEECWPWGARGFLDLSRELAAITRETNPDCRVVLSTWMYDTPPAGEWDGLTEALAGDDKPWIDAIMADAHEDFPRYPIDNPVPGGLPLYNFPEISMWGMGPWGGFGANPLVRRFQNLWDQTERKVSGGMPYSEGIYEDLNKIVVGRFYWNPDQSAEETVREYIAFEFSPDVVEPVSRAIGLLEDNHLRNQIGPSAVEAFQILEDADARMTSQARESWRWRILYLRGLIDSEMYHTGGELRGPILKKAFDELTDIQYAHNAWHRPPRID